MLKVFLVEDEFVVREGIKRNVDWASHGYEFCGEAADGELAYPLIQKLRPDIVITDIKMPFMDGLSLSRLLKKELPEIEILILTGHEEFEYAKEAISIGIAQYLLKPINGEELLREVDTIAGKIEEKRKAREIKERYLKEMEENVLRERKQLFSHLVSGQKSAVELIELGEQTGIDLAAIWYNLVLVKIQVANRQQDEYSDRYLNVEKQVEELCKEKKVLLFDRNLEGKALLFMADSREEIEAIQQEVLDELQKLLEQSGQFRFFGGIGEPVNRLRELSVSFERANHAYAYQYITKENCILDSANLEKATYRPAEEFNLNTVDPKQFERSKIKEFLRLGTKEEIVYFVEEFTKGLGANAMRSVIFRQYIGMDAYFCVVEFAESMQFSRDKIEAFDMEQDIIAYLKKILGQAIELREMAASNRYGDVVEEVMRYIEQNYAQDELSLNMLASHVNFSPNHLSTIFSQQTGQTLIKYLTDFRMGKAKELLRCTGKKTSVISQEVGYKDPHYFSYLFKKTQGMTPTQYRGGRGGFDEE